MRRIMILGLQVVVLLGLTGMAIAQTQTEEAPEETEAAVEVTPLSESDIALLRQDVQTRKMEIITDAMDFTDQDASAFWPVYRDYANEQQKLGDKKYQLIKDYAQNYDQMDDAKAAELTNRMAELDKAALENRLEFLPKFQKVLGAKRTAKFFQIDRRLSMMIDLQLASRIPIID